MGVIGWTGPSAAAARRRLLDDQLVRPLVEQRSRLGIIAVRFEQAAQNALLGALAGRARTDPRYRPVLQTLLDRTRAGDMAPARRGLDPGRLVPTGSGRVSRRA